MSAYSSKTSQTNSQTESIRNMLFRQQKGSSAIQNNIDAISFLAAVLKQASKADGASLDYPEIGGLGVILEHIADDMAMQGMEEMPYVYQWEKLLGVKLEGGNESE